MKKFILLFVLSCALLCSCMINKIKFKDLYDKHCHNQPWAKIAEDDSYLLIDSTWRGNNNYISNSDPMLAEIFLNQYGIEALYYTDAYDAVKGINKEIGFPEILNEQIIRASSGEDTINGIKITWKNKSKLSMEVWYSRE